MRKNVGLKTTFENRFKDQSGSSLILMVLITAVALFIAQMAIVTRQLEQNKRTQENMAQETRLQLVSFLDTALGQEMTLRNSRYSINAELKRCLTGAPNPCDEATSYDMVFASPTPPLVFQGGTWPDMPDGVPLLAGGLNTNKLFFTPTGAHCPDTTLTEANESCPLQAIIQFKPLCGGDINNPEISVGGPKPCTGGATGFDITVGVGKFLGNSLVYHQRTTSGGDAKVYRFSALILKN